MPSGDHLEAPLTPNGSNRVIKYRRLRPFKTAEIKILLLENVSPVAVKLFTDAGYQVKNHLKFNLAGGGTNKIAFKGRTQGKAAHCSRSWNQEQDSSYRRVDQRSPLSALGRLFLHWDESGRLGGSPFEGHRRLQLTIFQ